MQQIVPDMLKQLLVLLIALSVLLPAMAQDEPDEHCTIPDDAACTIELNIKLPIWLMQYPDLMGIVNEYTTGQLGLYLESLADNGFVVERGLFFEMHYRETRHSDSVVSVIFTQLYDLGGLYPISEIQTFTFDLEAQEQITFEELFLTDDIPYDVLSADFDDNMDFVFSHFDGVEDVADPRFYTNFMLNETDLVLYYPPVRLGAMNAGIIEYVISLEDLTPVLALPLVGK